eukprot:s24_g5.t1
MNYCKIIAGYGSSDWASKSTQDQDSSVSTASIRSRVIPMTHTQRSFNLQTTRIPPALAVFASEESPKPSSAAIVDSFEILGPTWSPVFRLNT